MENDKETTLDIARRWLDDIAKGRRAQAIETVCLQDLQVLEIHEGLVRCRFTIPQQATDEHGNWHVGAVASLVDGVGAVAIYSIVGHFHASVDFNISYFSMPRVNEEVEIEAKVAGQMERLASVVVEIRRKDNGGIVALGKQWMTTTAFAPTIYQNRIVLRKVSKL